MKVIHILAVALLSLAWSVGGWSADVRTIRSSHSLERPPGQTFTQFASNVAIDGGHLIVLATHDGGQSALLYHRPSGTGRFVYRATLLTFNEPRDRMQVRMKNGIAVVRFGDRAWIFERSGADYVAGPGGSSLAHPGGVAISSNRVLLGGDNCDYDGVIYQKGTDGRWVITGRLDDNQGQCAPEGVAVELYYDTAVIHTPGTPEVTTWQRNGSALNWIRSGSVAINSSVAASSGPFALTGATLVTPGSYVFRREGNAWNAHGRVVPADYGMGTGEAREVKHRDGVLVTSENWQPNFRAGVYVYLESAPGVFEHVAVLRTDLLINDHDVSGRTVVAGVGGWDGGSALVFALPDPIAAPDAIVADFDDGDASDFSTVSGQFGIATRGNNRVLAQTQTTGFSVAIAEASDSSHYQRIEARITPAYGTTDGWVGLIARYANADNYYYVAVRKSGTSGLYRHRNGVNELITSWSRGTAPQHLALLVFDGLVQVRVNQESVANVLDNMMPRGRVGLATYRAGADFDDVVISSAGDTDLLRKRFMPDADVPAQRVGREFSRIGGDWQYIEPFPNQFEGYQQRDPNRSAIAFIGAPVRNQEIDVAGWVDAVSSPTGAWVGVLGRYVDAQTHYRATLGNNGRVEIRKRVNGVLTLLASTTHGVNFGQYYSMRFRIVDDQLQLFVNDRKLLSVSDDDIPDGAHGLATNRAAATWEYMNVKQP